MKRTPLKKRRLTPRRNEGRVQHNRMNPKASSPPTAGERRYWDSLPASCVACGVETHVLHHILSPLPGKRSRRDHFFVVRLCPQCHNMGTRSVHLLGSEEAFKRATGTDLCAVAVGNLERWRRAHRAS